MIDNIWSGWRSQYLSRIERTDPDVTGREEGIRGRTSEASVFRRLLDSGLDDEEIFVVHRRSKVFTIMNSYPYAVGHVLVLPYRQVAELSELDGDEFAELWSEVSDAVEVVREALRPDGMNVGMNIGAASGGSVSEHLHVHVVPRWFGDSNFTVATASVKAIPEALDVTAARLRAVWPMSQNDGRSCRKDHM